MRAQKRRMHPIFKTLEISKYDLGDLERRIVRDLKSVEFATDDGHRLYRFVGRSGLSFVWDATSRRVRPSRYLTILWRTYWGIPVNM